MGLLAWIDKRISRNVQRHIQLASVSPLPLRPVPRICLTHGARLSGDRCPECVALGDHPSICPHCAFPVWEIDGALIHRHGHVDCAIEDVPR